MFLSIVFLAEANQYDNSQNMYKYSQHLKFHYIPRLEHNYLEMFSN